MPKTLKKLRTAQIPTHLSGPRKQEEHEKTVWQAQSGFTQRARMYDRELLRIPVSLQLRRLAKNDLSRKVQITHHSTRSSMHVWRGVLFEPFGSNRFLPTC